MTNKRVVKYWRGGGWHWGFIVSKGHKWVTIQTIKAGGKHGVHKVDVNDTDSYKEVTDE